MVIRRKSKTEKIKRLQEKLSCHSPFAKTPPGVREGSRPRMNWGGRIIERKKTISILAGQSRKSMRQPRFLAEHPSGKPSLLLFYLGNYFVWDRQWALPLRERDLEYLVSVEGELGYEPNTKGTTL
jgi:hypothetical protein